MSDHIDKNAHGKGVSVDEAKVSGAIADSLPPHDKNIPQIDQLVESVSFSIFSCFAGGKEKKIPPRENLLAPPKGNNKASEPEAPVEPESVATREDRLVPEKSQKKNRIERRAFGKPKEQHTRIKLLFENGTTTELEPSLPEKKDAPLPNAWLETLKKLGYPDLAARLEGMSGYPWDQIHQVEDAETVQQLVDLYDILHLRKEIIGKDLNDQIFTFALEQGREPLPERSKILGRLIFLIDKGPTLFISADLKRATVFNQLLTTEFENLFEKSVSQIPRQKEQHLAAGIQDADLAARNFATVALSRILLSETGKLNFGIIDIILENNFFEKISPITYRDNLVRILQSFRNQPRLREKLARIQKPKTPNSPSAVVIQTSLGICADRQVTDLEAKQAAFAALLSHLRQGSDGSCFATPLAIVLLTSHIERCLEDFASLLTCSKLTRTVNHTSRDFPFILRMAGNCMEKTISLDKNGTIRSKGRTGTNICASPGIAAACKAIGIDSVKEAVSKILDDHFKESEGKLYETTIKLFLQKLVLYAKGLPSNQQIGNGVLFLRASFAFEAQENNPLVQVWQNAIAGMAEPDETGMVKSAIISAVMEPIKKKLKEVLPDQQPLRRCLKKCIRKEVSRRIHLQYDPLVFSGEAGEDQKSTDGAFVLYDKHRTNEPSRWIRIDDPEKFQQFIMEVIEEAKKEIKSNSAEMSYKDAVNLTRTMVKIAQFASNKNYLLACLFEYYHRNKEIKDPLQNYEHIKYAPWVTKSGNNFSKVIQVYFEDFALSNNEVYQPKTPKELAQKIIEIGRKIQKEKGEDSLSHLMPVRIQGIHACNLMFSHPSIKEALQSKNDISKWLNMNILIPGKQISETLVEKDTAFTFIKEIKEKVLPEEMQDAFSREWTELPEHLTIRELRNLALGKAEAISRGSMEREELSNQIDMMLIEALPKELKNKIHDSAIHFADTNWSQGLHDIHMSFLVNPGTGELSLFAGYEDGSKLFPMSIKQWIAGKKWEFYPEVNH